MSINKHPTNRPIPLPLVRAQGNYYYTDVPNTITFRHASVDLQTDQPLYPHRVVIIIVMCQCEYRTPLHRSSILHYLSFRFQLTACTVCMVYLITAEKHDPSDGCCQGRTCSDFKAPPFQKCRGQSQEQGEIYIANTILYNHVTPV